jgi:hypothetical protein
MVANLKGLHYVNPTSPFALHCQLKSQKVPQNLQSNPNPNSISMGNYRTLVPVTNRENNKYLYQSRLIHESRGACGGQEGAMLPPSR